MEEAVLTLYRVRECGFYSDLGEHLFASFPEAMSNLLDWTETLGSIGESSTYAVDEDADILRAFCIDFKGFGSGRYLLATWNELPTVEEGVQVLQVTSPIGAANISAVEVDPMNLPGYPAFFVIDSRRNKVVNIRFDQRLNGSRQFQRFVAGYLTGASPWCVWNEDDTEDLLGYSNDDGEHPALAEGAVAKFATALGRLGSQESFIRNHCSEIRKVIRRATVDPEVEAHKSFLDSAFKLLGLPVNNRLRADINFQYEFKTRLTPRKLDSVIAEHEQNISDSWDDVGFVLARESQKIHWLSGAIARERRQIDVQRLENSMVDVEALAAYVEENFDVIMDSFGD